VTFSICVRERYEESGDEQYRFGVAVTTRIAGVGALCPFANEHGAVATQSLVNVDLGRKGVEYLADGLAVDDALEALLNADDGAKQRQLHGVGREDTFAFSGEGCDDWFGHAVGENYTVAGNLLTGESVFEATASTYEAGRDDDRPLAFRLAEALASGHETGGDKRTELHVQSAAVLVEDTRERARDPFYNDVRVDATPTPLEDLLTTLDTAREGYRMAMDRYEDAYEADEREASDTT